jgi:DNA-binding CsgD family transcriptional regulator
MWAGGAKPLLDSGWAALVKDKDVEALKYFELALEKATAENEQEEKALALFNIGICYYSVSYTKGMEYATKAMDAYKELEISDPKKALEGRSRCLQLISTISSRQGKFKEAIALSRQAMKGFPPEKDSTGSLALIYNSLGLAYDRLGMPDSSEYYHRLALKENELTHNTVYMPASCIYVAEIETRLQHRQESYELYTRALRIADSTGNRQAQSSALLGIGKWTLAFEKNRNKTEVYYMKAMSIANELSDKSFLIKCLQQLVELKKIQGNFDKALEYEEELGRMKDSLNSWEKQRAVQSLEVQFNVAEKDRLLRLAEKEKNIARLSNYLLWGAIACLLIISGIVIWFLRRINMRNKQLLKAKEELMAAREEQRRIKEQQLHNEIELKETQLQTKEALVEATREQQRIKEQHYRNEIEFRESQLSAMTLQMLQKNELMQELKEQLDRNKESAGDTSLNKIISKGFNQDKEWQDFNKHFESINKNFYSHLKEAYPDISPNDLKLCALIRLNLSTKEMAGILNISPDSVKTARYRLRKKLHLNTEDNLTEFIMKL